MEQLEAALRELRDAAAPVVDSLLRDNKRWFKAHQLYNATAKADELMKDTE